MSLQDTLADCDSVGGYVSGVTGTPLDLGPVSFLLKKLKFSICSWAIFLWGCLFLGLIQSKINAITVEKPQAIGWRCAALGSFLSQWRCLGFIAVRVIK